MTPRFRAALFDVDGTLLDSLAFVIGAFAHALRLHSRVPPSPAVLAAQTGPPLPDCYRALAPDLDPQQLCAAHRAWQRDHLHLVKPFPQAVAVLQILRDAGVRLAAVTARSKVSSLGTIDGAGLGGLLETVVSAEDAPRTKPHPDPLWLALERLAVAPAHAVMVGDTATDIAAGRAAGTATIGALYGFHGETLAASQPDYLVRDIREIVPIITRRQPS